MLAYKESVESRFGTLENFFNCTVNRCDDGGIDAELVPFLKKLNRRGAYTVMSCYGHKLGQPCYIDFATFVTTEKIMLALEYLSVDITKCKLEVKEHKFGFSYCRLLVLDKAILN